MPLKMYALGQKGIPFKGRLQNINNPDSPTDEDMSDHMKVYGIFVRPDGTRLEKEAAITDNDSDDANGADIEYIDNDPATPSILDMRKRWTFTVAVKFDDGRYIESPYPEIFWVE